MSEATRRRILLGHISTAHGIRGEVLVKTHTGDPAAIASYGPLTDALGQSPLKLKVLRVTPKGVIARVTGVADRNGAEALRGRELWVERQAMPEPEEDQFYHEDLIGMTAVDAAGAEIGRVVAVQNFGASDLLEIKPAAGGATELIPFTKAFVPTIDLTAKRIVVAMRYAESEEGEEREEEGREGDEADHDEVGGEPDAQR